LLISIHSHLNYSAQHRCSLLLQIEAAEDETQAITSASLSVKTDVEWSMIKGEENIGVRRWGRVEGVFDCTYRAQVDVDRPTVEMRGGRGISDHLLR
jgi:hypothetical protein